MVICVWLLGSVVLNCTVCFDDKFCLVVKFCCQSVVNCLCGV